MDTRIRFLSLNVGLKSDLAGLPTLIQVHKLDIILLQEVRLSDDQVDLIVGKHGFKGKVNINADEPLKPGTAIVWRSSLPVREVSTIVQCRVQCAFLGPYAFLNIYAPSGSDKKFERGSLFARDIFHALSLQAGSQWILGGDFNCVLKAVDIENGIGFTQKRCPQLADLVRGKNLHDAFRHLHPNVREFTFFRANAAPSRLDRFYLSHDILNRVSIVEHVASLSDHCGVVLQLLGQNLADPFVRTIHHNTYWKLNVSILKDEDFLHNFVNLWSQLRSKQCSYPDVADWWNFEAKPCIKDFCIEFSKQRKSRRNDTKKFWLAYLKIVLVRKDWIEITRVKGMLKDMLQEDALGYVVRSRFKNNAAEEVASLFHANQEVKNAKKNNVNSLKINGTVCEDKSVIDEEVTRYFHALFNGHHGPDMKNTGEPFKPDNSELDSFLHGLSTLPDDVRDKMVEEMTIDELEEIVKKCNHNKSPGLDGLSYEFYQETFDIIKEDLLLVYQCQLARKRIIESNTEGVTRLGPKVDGIPSVDELRPITLLDCDYKMLSKWFVMRMKPVLPLVIKSGQLCTVDKKNILFGVNNILSSILDIKQRNSQACMLSLDFFKAYDRVLLDFLVKVMKVMNFGELFTDWISMLHKGAKTRFILSGLTRAIEVLFSIRQGDPLAMLLYIVYIEPLLIALEKKMAGLKVATVEQKLEAYCDDINLLTDNLGDFEIVSEVIKKFENVSGAILSRDNKCKVIGFGKWAGKEVWPLDWIKPVKSHKVFGIFICDSYDEMVKVNWNYRFKKFSDVIHSWASRILDSLQQRVEVIRMFALSRVYYVAAILPVKSNMVRKFESLMGKFIWNYSGKVLRVALDEIKNDKSAGGLNLPCLASMADSLLFSQCIRLIRSGDRKSVQHFDFWLGDLLVDLVPGLGQTVSSLYTPEYFGHIGELFADMLVTDTLTIVTLKTITNKAVYAEMTSSFPPPKVVMESGRDYGKVWSRLNSSVVEFRARDVMFMLLHNKLPVQERLFRIRLRADPYCVHCSSAEIADVEHFFCCCVKSLEVWSWLKRKVMLLVGQQYQVVDWDVLNLFLPPSDYEQEIVWLVSSYVMHLWDMVYVRGAEVQLEQFFGFLTFKFREHQAVSKVQLKHLDGIS